MDERASGTRNSPPAGETTRAAGNETDPAAAVDATLDPLDEAPPTTRRGAAALTTLGVVLGLLAFLPTGLSFLFGPIGMGCGLVANLKGQRAGFAAAVLAAIGTIVGMSLRALLDLY